MLEILKNPHKSLSTPTIPVEYFNNELKMIAEEMLEVMYSLDGCGLAANQVGLPISLVVVDIGWIHEAKNPLILVNPKIISKSGKVIFNEGCLSFPGEIVRTMRAARIKVQYQTLTGARITRTYNEGVMPICIQHELQHLQGQTMYDSEYKEIEID